MKIVLTSNQVLELARDLATRAGVLGLGPKMFPIPRGGVPAAYALKAADYRFEIVNDPADADFFMDDIIDSGTTMQRWCDKYPEKPFVALIDKTGNAGSEFANGWIVFPWERGDEKETEGIEDNIIRLLQYIGEDPKRGGLLDTPKRVAKAWDHWSSGYKVDIPTLLKTFEDGADGCDEMVVVKDIPFYTHCEHHMAPFFGTATIAYIPDGRIVGLSKLPRVVNAFARRLQVQERLTNQIADAIQTNLHPKGVGVVIRARHLCMESRGIQQQGHHTITSALRGVMRESAEARAEFLDLAR